MLNSEYISQQSNYLISLGIANAKNEIIWYLEEKLKIKKHTYLDFKNQHLKGEIKTLIDQFITLRKQHIPYQYIMQKTDFFGKEFYIDENNQIARDDIDDLVFAEYDSSSWYNTKEDKADQSDVPF